MSIHDALCKPFISDGSPLALSVSNSALSLSGQAPATPPEAQQGDGTPAVAAAAGLEESDGDDEEPAPAPSEESLEPPVFLHGTAREPAVAGVTSVAAYLPIASGLELPAHRIVTAHTNCDKIFIWDSRDGRLIHSRLADKRVVTSVETYSTRDGSPRIITGGADTTIRVYDGETFAPVWFLDGHTGPVLQLKVFDVPSCESQRLLSLAQHSRPIRVHDLHTGDLVFKIEPPSVPRVVRVYETQEARPMLACWVSPDAGQQASSVLFFELTTGGWSIMIRAYHVTVALMRNLKGACAVITNV
jgi:WD40 repeat protein